MYDFLVFLLEMRWLSVWGLKQLNCPLNVSVDIRGAGCLFGVLRSLNYFRKTFNNSNQPLSTSALCRHRALIDSISVYDN